MRAPDAPPQKQPPIFWLTLLGGTIALSIIVVRFLTTPWSELSAPVIGIAIALVITAVIFAAFAVGIRNRMRVAAMRFPDAVSIPIVVGEEAAAASRWLVKAFNDPALALKTSRYSTITIDSSGLHVITKPDGPYGSIPASALAFGGIARTLVGAREMDALVLTVAVGGETAPVPVVPMRLRGNPVRALTDGERLEVAARIEAALAGRPTTPGWGY